MARATAVRPTAARQTEQQDFTMHPALLYSIIERQAGTLSKAILEGVMNAVDAGATHCAITLGERTVTVEDDGRGFTDKAQITRCFNTFGQPHEASEGKIYGEFRMGRGQLFKFGRNVWRTGPFEMDVDVKARGFTYPLATDLPPVPGCTIAITLYERLLPSQVQAHAKDVEQAVKYVSIPVTLNGKVVSTDPATARWDVETDDAYIKRRETGGLHIYNLGVFVRESPAYHFGTGGIVVAKRQLRVNFARNDVDDACPVWKRIKAALREDADEKIEKKATLNDHERQRLADRLLAGELTRHEAWLARILTDVRGKHWTMQQLSQLHWRWQLDPLPLSHAPESDARGDKLMQLQQAFILSDETLDRFGAGTLPELVARLKRVRYRKSGDQYDRYDELPREYGTAAAFKHFAVQSFAPLAESVSTRYQRLPEKEWTTQERLLLDVVRTGVRTWARLDDADARYTTDRRHVVGIAETALAWTDGETYVAFERTFLASLGRTPTIAEWTRLAHVVVHEYTHDGPSGGSHQHTPEFYETYHDHHALVGAFVEAAVRRYADAAATLGRKLSKKALRAQDQQARAEKADDRRAAAEARLAG